MRAIFALTIFMAVVYVFFNIRIWNRNKDALMKRFVKLVAVTCVTGLAYCGVLLSRHEYVSALAFGAYFVCISFLVRSFLLFVCEYTGYEIKRNYIKIGSLIILLVNAVILFMLAFGNQLASFQRVSVIYSEPMWVPEIYHVYYYCHQFICNILVLISALMLVVKSCKAPKLYRAKYYAVLIIFVSIIVMNALAVIHHFAFEVSAILYLIMDLVIYYCGIKYVPGSIALRNIKNVFDELDEIIVCFDFEDRCNYVNKYVKNLAGEKNPYDVCNAIFKKWKEEHPGFKYWDNDKFGWRLNLEIKGSTRIMDMSGQKNFDDAGNYLGCYFILKDKTATVKEFEARHMEMVIDGVSGVYRREYFLGVVKNILEDNPEKRYILVCTNICDFKIYNSIFGEISGNRVLKKIGERIKSLGKITVAYGRISGDRFGILVDKEKHDEEGLTRILKELADEFSTDFYQMWIQAGIYEIINMQEPVASMCEKANLAIRDKSKDFTDRIFWYDERQFSETINETLILGHFENAMREGQFHMYLQPQVTKKGKVIGAEALVRWIDADGNIIPPIEFIPALENNGMITILDMYIWECAVRRLAKWKQLGRSDLHISVNISAKDFYHTDLYEQLTRMVEQYKINPLNLKLEITETAIVSDSMSINKILQKLRGYGFEIEMDDFGSGYSSLGMLKDIVVDVLKLDMSFLRKADSTEEERIWLIMEQIVKLAESLKMNTVVEGVEELTQAERLSNLGCDIFQGFYFAKPEPVEVFEKRVGIG